MIGQYGWMIVERLVWASLSLALVAGVAFGISRMRWVSPAVKAWSWRLALLQPLVVLFGNAAYMITLKNTETAGIGAEGAPSLILASLGAGLAAFWLYLAIAKLGGLVLSGMKARRMLAELPSIDAPRWASGVPAKFRLMTELNGPVVAMIPGAVIAAPEWCWRSDHSARMAIAHEAAHLRRWDIQWQVVASVSAAFFWFHPLAMLAHRELAFWQECAADDQAIRAMECEKEAYVDVLMGIVTNAKTACVPGALGLGMQARLLGRRLEIALDTSAIPRWTGTLVAAITLLPVLVPWRFGTETPKPAANPSPRMAAPVGEVYTPVGGPASGPTRMASPVPIAGMAGGG